MVEDKKEIEYREVETAEGIILILSHFLFTTALSFIIAVVLKYYGMDVFYTTFQFLLNYKDTNVFKLAIGISVSLIIIYILFMMVRKIFRWCDRIRCVICNDMYCCKDLKTEKYFYVPKEYIVENYEENYEEGEDNHEQE